MLRHAFVHGKCHYLSIDRLACVVWAARLCHSTAFRHVPFLLMSQSYKINWYRQSEHESKSIRDKGRLHLAIDATTKLFPPKKKENAQKIGRRKKDKEERKIKPGEKQ